MRPDVYPAKVGDIVTAAKAAKHRRTSGEHRTAAIGAKPHAPKPANFDQMVFTARQITREFKAHGITPTKGDVDRELARRLRDARDAA